MNIIHKAGIITLGIAEAFALTMLLAMATILVAFVSFFSQNFGFSEIAVMVIKLGFAATIIYAFVITYLRLKRARMAPVNFDKERSRLYRVLIPLIAFSLFTLATALLQTSLFAFSALTTLIVTISVLTFGAVFSVLISLNISYGFWLARPNNGERK